MGFFAILQLIGLIISIVRGIPDFIKLIKLLRELLRGADKATVAAIGDKLKAAHAQYQFDKDEEKLMSTVKQTVEEFHGCVIKRRCARS